MGQVPSKIELVKADVLEGNEEILGKNVRRLAGNVVFKQDEVFMYCDSSYFYSDDNSLDAWGHILITQGDTIQLTGEQLKYNGNTKKAVVERNIVMRDRKATLTTHILEYDMSTETAEYFEEGKIVDSENVLTSRNGIYSSKSKTFFFREDVVLTNPEYIMYSDSLQYYSPYSTAYFFGPTIIVSTGEDSNFIYCERGWYNTKTEKSYFSRNAYILSKTQKLAGDSLLYDRISGVGEAYQNVSVIDTVEKIMISGEKGIFKEKEKKSFITGRTMLTQIFDNDSLFMHADTLFAAYDSSGAIKNYYAFYHVRFFKSDLRGVCDSLTYSSADSTLRLLGNPVLWNNENQLTADTMFLVTGSSAIYSLVMINSSFIISKEDSLRFNQVKGKDMTGHFMENKLYKIDVNGNGQTIYYGKNNKEELVGVNRADCSDMLIFVSENKVEKISLLNKPEATFYPINELQPEELKLRGFLWQQHRQPLSKEDIFIWR